MRIFLASAHRAVERAPECADTVRHHPRLDEISGGGDERGTYGRDLRADDVEARPVIHKLQLRPQHVLAVIVRREL